MQVSRNVVLVHIPIRPVIDLTTSTVHAEQQAALNTSDQILFNPTISP